MPTALVRSIRFLLAICLVMATCGGSFVTGYYSGYTMAWDEVMEQDKETFKAVQWYRNHKPGR